MLGNSRTSFRYHWLDWFVSWTGQQVRVGVLLKIGGGGHLQGLPTVYQTVSMRNQPLQQEPSGKKAILQRVRVYEARLIRPWLSASSGRIKNWYYFEYQIVKPYYLGKT